jgi:hypothetical protein
VADQVEDWVITKKRCLPIITGTKMKGVLEMGRTALCIEARQQAGLRCSKTKLKFGEAASGLVPGEQGIDIEDGVLALRNTAWYGRRERSRRLLESYDPENIGSEDRDRALPG